MNVLIETTARVTKSGISAKSQKPYIMVEAFVHTDGSKYPQFFEYYAGSQNEILPAGFYNVPVSVSVRDGRLTFFPELQKGVRANSPVAATAPKAPSA